MESFKSRLYTFLRKSERIFKTDMVYLVGNSFWLGLSQIVISVSAFLMAIAFAHFVSKESYGEYKYVLAVVAILSNFTLSGLGTALVRSINRGFEGTLVYAFWQNIKWSFLFFVGFLIVAVYYFLHSNLSLGVGMLVVGSLAPVLESTNFYNAYLSAKKDFKRSALYYNVIGNLFPYICLLATIMVTDNPLWLVTVYFVSNTLIGIILFSRVLKIYEPNREVDPEVIHYSKHLSFINIIGGIANNIDQVLAFHFIGAAELAVYNFAIAIPNQLKAIPNNVSSMMFPKFVVRADNEIRASMKNKVVWLVFAGIIMTFGYIIIAPWVYTIFFPKYTDAIFYSQISILPMLVIAFEPAASYLTAKKKIKEQYIANISSSIFQIVCVSVGVIWWGLLGLVIARTLSRFFANIMMGVLYETSSRQAIS